MGPSLWGPAWARALTYMTIQTIFGVWLFMMPLLDMGVGGIKMGALAPVITLIRHWGYGLTIAFLYPLPEVAPAGQAAVRQSV